jgi:hypothetical protein
MISLFKEYNIIPIFVFDGVPPKEKETIIKKRQNDKLMAKQKCEELEKQLINTANFSEQTNLNKTKTLIKKY